MLCRGFTIFVCVKQYLIEKQRLIMEELVKRAKEVATQQYDGSMYKGKPFVQYLDMVYELWTRLGIPDPHIGALIYLKDVYKNTPLLYGEIRDMFGQRIANAALLLTTRFGYKESDVDAYYGLIEGDRDCSVVVVLDSIVAIECTAIDLSVKDSDTLLLAKEYLDKAPYLYRLSEGVSDYSTRNYLCSRLFKAICLLGKALL